MKDFLTKGKATTFLHDNKSFMMPCYEHLKEANKDNTLKGFVIRKCPKLILFGSHDRQELTDLIDNRISVPRNHVICTSHSCLLTLQEDIKVAVVEYLTLVEAALSRQSPHALPFIGYYFFFTVRFDWSLPLNRDGFLSVTEPADRI